MLTTPNKRFYIPEPKSNEDLNDTEYILFALKVLILRSRLVAYKIRIDSLK